LTNSLPTNEARRVSLKKIVAFAAIAFFVMATANLLIDAEWYEDRFWGLIARCLILGVTIGLAQFVWERAARRS